MTDGYDQLLRRAANDSLSSAISAGLVAAEQADEAELARWIRCELLGWYAPQMRPDEEVPEYRTVGGRWYDEYGRVFVIDDPGLQFINQTRLRHGVPELETLAGAGTVNVADSHLANVIQESLGVNVTRFTFASESLDQVLAHVRARYVNQLVVHRRALSARVPAGKATKPEWDEILQVKPTFQGVGIDILKLIRRWRSRD